MFDICLQFFDNRVKFTLALLLLKPLLKINQSKDILIINKLKGASYFGSSFFVCKTNFLHLLFTLCLHQIMFNSVITQSLYH